MKKFFVMLLVSGFCACAHPADSIDDGKNLDTPSVEVHIKVFADGESVVKLESNFSDEIITMKNVNGVFEYSFEFTLSVVGPFRLLFTNDSSVIVPRRVELDGIQICMMDGSYFVGTLPLVENQPCEDAPYLVPTGNFYEGIASLEWGQGGFSVCNPNVVADLKLMGNWMKFIPVDIKAFTDSACVQTMKNLYDVIAVPYVFYINAQELRPTDSTPWYQEMYDWVVTNAPQWFLKDTNGNNVEFWPGMYALNQMVDSPVVSGKRWREWVVDRAITVIENSGIAYAVSGVHFDNMNQVMEWKFRSTTLNIDVTPWEYDEKTIQGIRAMIDYTRARKPEWKIFGLANTELFEDVLDGITYENFLMQDLGDEGGMFTKVMQLENSIKYNDIYALHHTWNLNANRDSVNTTELEEFETGYALAQMFGANFAWDGGDREHGSFVALDEYITMSVGQPVGDVVEPYKRLYSQSNSITLENGECFDFPGQEEDILVVRYIIHEGVYLSSNINGSVSSNNWRTGLRYAKVGYEARVCHTGPGYTELRDLAVFENSADGVFFREFEGGEVFVNPHDYAVEVQTKAGNSITIKPATGRIVPF